MNELGVECKCTCGFYDPNLYVIKRRWTEDYYKEYQKKYRQEHKDKMKEYQKKYREKNKLNK